MESYVYPYDEFARDFDAVVPPMNAAPRTFGHSLHVLREHIRATYPDEIDRVERGSALGMIASFLSKHMAEFDTGRIAVRGTQQHMISEHLLQAAHTLVCRYCFGDAESMPDPREVRELAEQLAQTESQNEGRT